MAKEKQSEASQGTLKDCFIITPIGAIGSETFKKTDGLIKTVLAPILAEYGFKAIPAYDISASGSITKQVIEHVINDELVIANLTGLNPNVMYELALRHAFKRKVITMAEHGTSIPFDISDQRTIFYEDNLHGAMTVKPVLAEFIKDAIDNDVTSNPVIDSIKEAAVINAVEANPDKDGTTRYLLDRFDRLERLVSSIGQQQTSKGPVEGSRLKLTVVTTFSDSKEPVNDESFTNFVKSSSTKFGFSSPNIRKISQTEYEVTINSARSFQTDLFINEITKEFGFETISTRNILVPY